MSASAPGLSYSKGRRWKQLTSSAAVIASVLLSVSAVAEAAVDLNREVAFSIPSQPLDAALIEFSRQADVQLAISATSLEQIQSPVLKGKLAANIALSRLLSQTELRFYTVGSTVTVVPAKQSSTPEQPTRLSQAAPAATDAPTAPWDKSSPAATTAKGTGDSTMSEVTVTGHYEYLSADTSGTTNLPLPIERVPQSISIVSNDFIEAADLKTLGQIAEYTPGALNAGNQEGLGSVIKLRGFSPVVAFDGVTSIETFVTYEPDYAIFDRMEIVKGPSSVVYGVSSPGGLINYVTKSATAQTPSYLSAQVGNWNNFRVEGQFATALTADGRVRAIGVAVQDQGGSFIGALYHKKTALYAGINADLSDSVTAYLHGGYERFERPSFDGIPTESDGSAAPLPRSFCTCSESIVMTTSVYYADSDLTWHATDMLDFTLKGRYQNELIGGAEDYASGLDAAGNITVEAQKIARGENQNYGIEASGLYKFDNLGLKNSFASVAALYEHNLNYQNILTDPNFVASANIFAGEASIRQAMESLLSTATLANNNMFSANTLTLSGQFLWQATDPLALLLGVSYSKPKITAASFSGPAQELDIPGQTSYRAGLTYEFLPRTNAYVSFSQSFNPQPLPGSDQTFVPPAIGNQYEAGLKYRSGDGRLLLTGAVFQIREKNLAQYSSTTVEGVAVYSVTGQLRHRGVELQALGHLTPEWQINTGYSYLDPKITNNDPAPATVGETELFLPKQTFSLYTTYTLHEGMFAGLSFGGGARYVSNQRTAYQNPLANDQTGLSPTRGLPGYPLFDATVSYSMDKWLLQLNGRNILNRRYFINNYQSLQFGNLPGDPASIAASVRYSF